jgi:phytanoyl-CoA hydroxylase
VRLDGGTVHGGSAAPGGLASPPPAFAADPDLALARYRRDGLHVEHALLTAAECAGLCAAACALGDGGAPPVAPVMNPHLRERAFLAALCHPAIVTIVERLLGGAVSAIQSQFFPGVPGTPGFAAHQDNHYVEAPCDAFASAWIALDDVTRDNGALIAYPGSQREPLLPVEPIAGARPHPTQAFNAIRQQVAVPEHYAACTIELPRGAVVFLHGHLLHASHANRSTVTRRALLTTYLRRGAPFRRGASARRTEIDVYRDQRLRIPRAAAEASGRVAALARDGEAA